MSEGKQTMLVGLTLLVVTFLLVQLYGEWDVVSYLLGGFAGMGAVWFVQGLWTREEWR